MCFKLVDLVENYNKPDLRCSEIPILKCFAIRAKSYENPIVLNLSQICIFTILKKKTNIRTIERAIKRLIEKGFISILKKGNNLTHEINTYLLNPERLEHYENIELTCQETSPGVFEKESEIEVTNCNNLPTKLSPEIVDNVHRAPGETPDYVNNIFNNNITNNHLVPSTEPADPKLPDDFEKEILKLKKDAQCKIEMEKLTSNQLKELYDKCIKKKIDISFTAYFKSAIMKLHKDLGDKKNMSYSGKSYEESLPELDRMKNHTENVLSRHDEIKPIAVFNLSEARKSLINGKIAVESKKRATG